MTDRSEMVNQLLFGELVEIVQQEDKWLRISHTYDNYEGWVDVKQVSEIDLSTFTKINEHTHHHLLDIHTTAKSANRQVQLVMGSPLPYYKKHSFTLIKEKFNIKKETVSDKSFKANEENLLTVVNRYLGTPYLWGGRSPFGIDCSGFTQMVFKFFGVELNRDTYQQAEQGRTIDFVESSQPGDLAFFHNENKRIVHTGIILKDKKIIHASGCVRMDILDHHGIYNEERKTYTHHLSFIKRVL
jgi:gamma-D-glutamyl-L-lysine dipeptidyl-peptidase